MKKNFINFVNKFIDDNNFTINENQFRLLITDILFIEFKNWLNYNKKLNNIYKFWYIQKSIIKDILFLPQLDILSVWHVDIMNHFLCRFMSRCNINFNN